MRDDERAERERLYREGMATYEATDIPAHLTATAIVNCHMCDDDGYRQNRICDHEDRTQTATRGSQLVRQQLAKKAKR